MAFLGAPGGVPGQLVQVVMRPQEKVVPHVWQAESVHAFQRDLRTSEDR